MICNKCGTENEEEAKFCSKCGANFLEGEVSNTLVVEKRRKKKRLIFGVLAVLVVVLGMSVISYRDYVNEHISQVKEGTNVTYPTVTYGEAFDNFFGNPTWDYFSADDGMNVVEFSGMCGYKNEQVVAVIQFTFYDDEDYFEASYLSFNGEPQSQNMLNSLIDKALQDEFWRKMI